MQVDNVSSMPPRSRDSLWAYAAILPLALGIACFASWDARPLIAILCVLCFLIVPATRPELALAVLFNGTLLFFYSLYKLGYEPSQAVTGGFYALLLAAYSLPAMLLLTKGKSIRFTTIDVIFILYFAWLVASYFLFGTSNDRAATKMNYAPLMVIGPYIGVRLLASRTRLHRFFDHCVVVGIALMGAAFYELFYRGVLARSMRFSICVFSEHRVNPIVFGTTFSVLALIALVRLFDGRKDKYKYLFIALLSMWLVLRAGSRGAMVSLCVSGVCYFAFLVKARPELKVVILLSIVGLASAGVASLPKTTRGFYQYSLTAEASADEVSSIHTRLYFWYEALHDFLENPVLGVGTGNSVGGLGYPHNIVLEILAEHGVVGFTLFAGLCILAVRRALLFVGRQRSPEAAMLGKEALVLFVYALTEAFFSNYVTRQTQLFMMIAIIASLESRTAREYLRKMTDKGATESESSVRTLCCPA